MGKSASGKDSIYQNLLEDTNLHLKEWIPYTTRPIREGETDGKEYHFVTEEELELLCEKGKVVELRTYHTVKGIWKYFTVFEDTMDLRRESYAIIGTLEVWHEMCKYFGREKLLPIYIEVEDGKRLQRALARESSQKNPNYAELCRRFLADMEDFSEQKLKDEAISRRFQNEDFERCLQEIKVFIQKEMST